MGDTKKQQPNKAQKRSPAKPKQVSVKKTVPPAKKEVAKKMEGAKKNAPDKKASDKTKAVGKVKPATEKKPETKKKGTEKSPIDKPILNVKGSGAKKTPPEKTSAVKSKAEDVKTKAEAKSAAKPGKPSAAASTAAEAKKIVAVKTPANEWEIFGLDPVLKRPAKIFFYEVKPGSERVIKRGDKSLASPAPLDIQSRRKGTTAEESPEELVERIERELEHQFFVKRNALKPQLCTKCGINAVSQRFTIDRELGYCDDCAEILRLGETKEARRMEFNPAVSKSEGDDKSGSENGLANEEEGGAEAAPDTD